MGKLLININIVQTQLWEKPIYNLLSSFRKQHVPSRLFIRIFFFFGKGGGAGREPIKRRKIIHFATTNSACALFNCFKQGFNCIADIKILILAAKNTLKATETEMFFVPILPWTQIHSYQFDAARLLIKNV